MSNPENDSRQIGRWQFSLLDLIVCALVVCLVAASVFQVGYLAPWLVGLATFLVLKQFESRCTSPKHPLRTFLAGLWGAFVGLTLCVPASLFVAAALAAVLGIRMSFWHVIGGGALVGVVLGFRFHSFFGQIGPILPCYILVGLQLP
jgi:hypothetical protein